MIELLRWLGILIRAVVREPRFGAGEPGPSPATGSAEEAAGSSATEGEGSIVLGGAFSNLGALATSLALGQGGHGRGLATQGLQNLLGQSFPAKKGRSAASEFGAPSANPADGGRQPVLGRASPSRGIAQAGNRDLGAHGFPLHAQEPETPFPDLEGFPEQPCPGSSLGRFLHRADGQLSGGLRVYRVGSSSPPHR